MLHGTTMSLLRHRSGSDATSSNNRTSHNHQQHQNGVSGGELSYQKLYIEDEPLLREESQDESNDVEQQQQQQQPLLSFQKSHSIAAALYSWSTRPRTLLLLCMICAVFVFYECFMRGSNSNAVAIVHVSKETRPTLFSIVDATTLEYINALENDLYEALKTATFHRFVPKSSGDQDDDDDNDDDRKSKLTRPQLILDRTKINLHDPLRLSWTSGKNARGEPLVSDDDIILLYCGDSQSHNNSDPVSGNTTTSEENFNLLEAATIEQIKATSARNTNEDSPVDKSKGNMWYIPSFPIIRQEVCQFILYHKATATEYDALRKYDENDSTSNHYVLSAESPYLYLRSINTPTAIHMAVSTDPTEMVIHFVTGGSGGTPVAEYSMVNDTGKTIQKATGTSDTYTASDMCQAPANQTEPGKFQSPGQLHTIVLTGLQPNTAYEYKVGLAGGQGVTWSDTFTFTSALAAGDPQPFSFLVYADQGCPSKGWGYGAEWTTALATRELNETRKRSQELAIRAVHHFGDLSYAQGAAHIWDEWFAMIQPFATRVPLMIGIGNHEYDHTAGGENGKDPSGVTTPYGFMPSWGNFYQDSGGECGVPTAKRFTMPASPGSNGVFWYSYDMGSVHVIMISSEHDLGTNSPQHRWLYEDLASVDRNKTPWLIVESHRPLYEGEALWDNNAVGIAMRFEIEDLLRDFKVDLFLAGHYHAYHRTCDGLYRSRCDNGGPMHITIGSAGAHLDDAQLYWNRWTATFIRHEYGYGRITIMNATAMHFQFIKAGDQNDTSAGLVHDDFWIKRKR